MYDLQGVFKVSGFPTSYQDAPQQGNKYADTHFIFLYISYIYMQVIYTISYKSCAHTESRLKST
jgi:hypothetical protein